MVASSPPRNALEREPEPRWPVALALLAAAGLHFVLPRSLVMGPPWIVRGAFLFPQMLLPGADAAMVPEDDALPEPSWRPGFVDYLFLAFSTSTAFSPTDVPVLSRWAKGMMMVQACISFTSVAVIAARA